MWAAVDPDTEQLVHVAVAEGRSGVDARGFLKRVFVRRDNRPVLHVDRGVGYPWRLTLLDLDWQGTVGGVRNTVDTWFGLLKERIGPFRRRWPTNASNNEVEAWVEGFAGLFNQDPSARLT